VSARFTGQLREAAEPQWSAAVEHRFTHELAGGTLDQAVFRRYLVQDYAFIATLASLVGFAVGHAPTMGQKSRLTGFLSVLTGGENSYFLRSFEALDVAEAEWRGATAGPVARALGELFDEAVAAGGYAEILSVLLPVEWVYLTWATAASDARPDKFYFAQWITLHNDPDFRIFVEWLRSELDDAAAGLADARRAHVTALFKRAVALEVAFFEEPYGAG